MHEIHSSNLHVLLFEMSFGSKFSHCIYSYDVVKIVSRWSLILGFLVSLALSFWSCKYFIAFIVLMVHLLIFGPFRFIQAWYTFIFIVHSSLLGSQFFCFVHWIIKSAVIYMQYNTIFTKYKSIPMYSNSHCHHFITKMSMYIQKSYWPKFAIVDFWSTVEFFANQLTKII